MMINPNRLFVLGSSLPVLFLAALLFQNHYDETIAQLDIPEAKPLESFGTSSANTTGFLVFEDLGYKIEYPDDWEVVAPGVEFGLSTFQAPDGSSITVKFIPKDAFDADNIQELLEQYQEEGTQNTFTANSTTTLGGLPAFIEEGIFTFTPNVFQSIAGEQGYTTRVYFVWGESEDKDGFYGVLFHAASKAQYDETLPVAKKIIESFTVEEGAPNTQTEIEESPDEEPDDTFVGSAGNEVGGEEEESEEENNE